MSMSYLEVNNIEFYCSRCYNGLSILLWSYRFTVFITVINSYDFFLFNLFYHVSTSLSSENASRLHMEWNAFLRCRIAQQPIGILHYLISSCQDCLLCCLASGLFHLLWMQGSVPLASRLILCLLALSNRCTDFDQVVLLPLPLQIPASKVVFLYILLTLVLLVLLIYSFE